MEKDIAALDSLIAAEKKKLAGYEARRDSLIEKIKRSKAELSRLTMIKA